ncbi:hypothetical protein TRVL_06643 [Trypanosoma vivax]|nr:hypothetical protein TRVL_06643 [Trypanosoma vivax]
MAARSSRLSRLARQRSSFTTCGLPSMWCAWARVPLAVRLAPRNKRRVKVSSRHVSLWMPQRVLAPSASTPLRRVPTLTSPPVASHSRCSVRSLPVFFRHPNAHPYLRLKLPPLRLLQFLARHLTAWSLHPTPLQAPCRPFPLLSSPIAVSHSPTPPPSPAVSTRLRLASAKRLLPKAAAFTSRASRSAAFVRLVLCTRNARPFACFSVCPSEVSSSFSPRFLFIRCQSSYAFPFRLA